MQRGLVGGETGLLFFIALGIVPDIPCDHPGAILLSSQDPQVPADRSQRRSLEVALGSQVTIETDAGKRPVARGHDFIDGQSLVEAELLRKAVEGSRFVDAYILEPAGNHPNRVIGKKVEVVIEVIRLKALHSLRDEITDGLSVVYDEWLRRHDCFT